MTAAEPASCDPFAFRTIDDLASLLARGEVTSVQLTRLVLDRLAADGPALNAVAALLPERALREAAAVDRRRRSGAVLSPLAGIPYGAKDLLAARGAPTAYGAAPFRNQVFEFDAAPIQRLAARGAVLAAKLALMELVGLHAMTAHASMHGPGRNPWDPRRWSGGSSSGSAAAVAAGLVPYALASETGGSIGTPSSLCGVTGLRPTYGLVSRHGAMPLSWTLDKIGVIARSARDCGLVLDAIAGPDARDPASARRRFRYQPTDRPADALRSLRVGVADSDLRDSAAPAIRPALHGAVATLSAEGAAVREVALPPHAYREVIATVIGAESASAWGDWIERGEFEGIVDAGTPGALRASLGITARDYLDAMRIRRRIVSGMAELFRSVDVLVSYAVPWPAPDVDLPFPPVAGKGGLSQLIAASNLAGLPAIFLPVGFTTSGLPVGIQVVGPAFSEGRLIAIGEAFQAVTDWHTRVPPAVGAGRSGAAS